MGYKRWRPNSRRNRRASGSSRRSGTQESDVILFVVLGAFVLLVMGVILAITLLG